MRTATVVAALSAIAGAAAQTTGKLGDAKVITNNPANASFVATITTNSTLKGRVLAASSPFGIGTVFHIEVSGLPADQGPFTYHLHKEPVPANGSCAATLTHLDPYQRTADPACDASKPQTCEVGDLAGKYGKINSTEASKDILDLYASLDPASEAYFANRSVVIHNAKNDRLACANFVAGAARPGADAGRMG